MVLYSLLFTCIECYLLVALHFKISGICVSHSCSLLSYVSSSGREQICGESELDNGQSSPNLALCWHRPIILALQCCGVSREGSLGRWEGGLGGEGALATAVQAKILPPHSWPKESSMSCSHLHR